MRVAVDPRCTVEYFEGGGAQLNQLFPRLAVRQPEAGLLEVNVIPPRREDFRPARLETAALPLDPDKRLAMKRAQGAITEVGRFRGMLPVGSYQLGHVSFEIVSGVREQVVQLRNDVGPYERTPPPPR